MGTLYIILIVWLVSVVMFVPMCVSVCSYVMAFLLQCTLLVNMLMAIIIAHVVVRVSCLTFLSILYVVVLGLCGDKLFLVKSLPVIRPFMLLKRSA